MTPETPLDRHALDDAYDDVEIDRGATGVRIGLSLLFFVVARLIEGVLLVLVLFELGFTLVTQREPSDAVRRVGNQLVSYLVHIGRYLTYNADDAPFPFQEFPAELDLTIPATRSTAVNDR